MRALLQVWECAGDEARARHMQTRRAAERAQGDDEDVVGAADDADDDADADDSDDESGNRTESHKQRRRASEEELAAEFAVECFVLPRLPLSLSYERILQRLAALKAKAARKDSHSVSAQVTAGSLATEHWRSLIPSQFNFVINNFFSSLHRSLASHAGARADSSCY